MGSMPSFKFELDLIIYRVQTTSVKVLRRQTLEPMTLVTTILEITRKVHECAELIMNF